MADGLRLHVQASAVRALFRDVGERQMPYAMSLGLNRLANVAQEAVRVERLQGKFRLRQQAWNLRAIKIDKADRANKQAWRVVVQVDPRADYLNKFEQEGMHEPFGGRRYLWVPNSAVFRGKIIQAGNPLHPKALRLHRVGSRVVGAQRTFMVRTDEGPIVLQRIDRGLTKRSQRRLGKFDLDNVAVGLGPRQKHEQALARTAGVRCLYVLRERVRVPLKLEFVPTVARTVRRQAEPVFREAVGRTLATARR
jgi:hypothetical protein